MKISQDALRRQWRDRQLVNLRIDQYKRKKERVILHI